MDKDIVKENDRKLKELEKLGNPYFEMFGRLVMEGMQIQNAIDECYKKLIKKSSLTLLVEEMKKPFTRKKNNEL